VRCKKRRKDFFSLTSDLNHNGIAEHFQFYPPSNFRRFDGGGFSYNFRNCSLRPVLMTRLSKYRKCDELFSFRMTQVLPEAKAASPGVFPFA
jgi:hypothetical protein